MNKFLEKVFGVKGSSTENEKETVEIAYTVEEKIENKEEFFNTPQNDLLISISQALSDDRREALKVFVKQYQEEHGQLRRDAVFYKYDKVMDEWYCCAPLYKWCCNIECRDLFYLLVEA